MLLGPTAHYFGIVSPLRIVEIQFCLDLPDYMQRKGQDRVVDKILFYYLFARPCGRWYEHRLAERPRLLDSFLNGLIVSTRQLP